MKSVLLFIIVFIVVSCNTSEIKINEKSIKQLAQGDFKIPSVHGFSLLFVSSEHGEKGCTNVNVLHEVFLRSYSETYTDFESFLSDALNQKIKFSKEELDKWGAPRFELEEIISEKYNQSKISDFIKEYFDKTNDHQKFVVKAKYSNEEYLYTILYYCFINDYKISLDDIRGEYFIKSNSTID